MKKIQIFTTKTIFFMSILILINTACQACSVELQLVQPDPLLTSHENETFYKNFYLLPNEIAHELLENNNLENSSLSTSIKCFNNLITKNTVYFRYSKFEGSPLLPQTIKEKLQANGIIVYYKPIEFFNQNNQ